MMIFEIALEYINCDNHKYKVVGSLTAASKQNEKIDKCDEVLFVKGHYKLKIIEIFQDHVSGKHKLEWGWNNKVKKKSKRHKLRPDFLKIISEKHGIAT